MMEVLLVVAVVAVLAITFYSGYEIGRRSVEAGQRTEAVEEIRTKGFEL